jgi:hypothetical protein
MLLCRILTPMWPNEKQRQDKSGKHWNFQYQYFGKPYGQRLFFWDDALSETGVLLFSAENPRTYKQIENLIVKLVADPEFRKLHRRELQVPMDRFYSEPGAFPEEKNS